MDGWGTGEAHLGSAGTVPDRGFARGPARVGVRHGAAVQQDAERTGEPGVPVGVLHLAAVGPDRHIVFVNIFADRPWLDEVDGDLAAFVAAHPQTALADWHDAIAARPDLLGPDGIHPGSQGGVLYADCVASALDRLG